MRKGEFFRYAKLNYTEIGCPDVAAKPLVNLGWVTLNPELSMDQLFGLLRKAEVVEAFGISASGKLKRKSELLDDLRLEFNEERSLKQWTSVSEESIYKVNVTSASAEK